MFFLTSYGTSLYDEFFGVYPSAHRVLMVLTIGVRHLYNGKRWWDRVELIKFLIANKVRYCVNIR